MREISNGDQRPNIRWISVNLCVQTRSAASSSMEGGLCTGVIVAAPVVVQTEHLDPAAAAWLGERCRLVVCPHDSSDFHAAIKEADAFVVRTYTRVDSGLLSHGPRLRVVGRAGVGLDNVDVLA